MSHNREVTVVCDLRMRRKPRWIQAEPEKELNMIVDDLRHLMRKTPFEPFRIHRQDGRSFLVPRGGWLLVADDFVEVGLAKGRRSEIADGFARIPMTEITRAEIVKKRKQ